MRTFCARAAGVVLIVMAAAACGTISRAPNAQMIGGDGAVVDPVRGTVRLPLDAYLPSRAERGVFAYAVDIAAARCARAKGVEVRPLKRSSSEVAEGFGVWRLADARSFGYGSPPADASMRAFDARFAGMSDVDRNAVRDCELRPETAELKYPIRRMGTMLPFLRELSRVRSIDTRQGHKVLDDWRRCLEEADITPPENPKILMEYDWRPPEVPSMSPRSRLRTAVADVECKEETRLVQRLSDIEAGRQRMVMAGHESQLVAYRELWHEHLAVAQKVVADHRQDG